MASSDGIVRQECEDKQIYFQDLESLLQRCLHEKELQVINQSVTKLLSVGENYGSIMLKIDAVIRISKIAKEETLYIVAKTPSCSENSLIQWPLIFEKEVFMYTELFPLYRELEREAGIDEVDLIDMLPKYIGHRNSLKNNEDVDENSALLLENLKVKGFYTVDRRVGLDVHHARKALPLLARYHALGIAMQQQKPSLAKKAIDQARILGTDFSQLDGGFTAIYELFEKTPQLQKYSTEFESSFQLIKGGGTWKAAPVEPWATITHNDFWASNILFHKDDSGNVDDVKFIDFQGYIYSSPLKDLLSLFTANIDKPTQSNHFEELIDLYYDTFVKMLKRMGCNVLPFTRKSFDNELKKQAIIQFPICALAIKFLGSDEVIREEKSNEENLLSVFNAVANDAFIDRLMWILQIYEKMKWL